MLTELLTFSLAALGALAWVGVCLLPLCLAWGLWLWFKSPSNQQFEQQQGALNAFIQDSDAFLARFKAEQAARDRRLQHR